MKYLAEAKRLWKTAVPRSGQADTVQGELLRAVEKLRDEAQRNGNVNWDEGHEILLGFLEATLLDAAVFDAAGLAELRRDLGRLKDTANPETSEDPYDRIADRVIEWCLAHPDPVPHAHNAKLNR
jgi:hypothetical protein